MRFRLGLLTGFAAGYYLGSKAGRERYDQINEALGKLRGTPAYETATEKAREVVDIGVDKARESVEKGVEKAKDKLQGDDSAEEAAEASARTGGNGIKTPGPFPDARP